MPAPDGPEALDPNFRIELPNFEGPLDLLLHLIRKHELDILDLPIAFITDKYLEYLGLMEGLNLDVASEYLVMAATLANGGRDLEDINLDGILDLNETVEGGYEDTGFRCRIRSGNLEDHEIGLLRAHGTGYKGSPCN